MRSKLIKNASQYLINLPGWHTRRKIVIFESDDWGSERTVSDKSYNYLLRNGLRVDLCPYSIYDRFESEADLTMLFDVLSKFKDKANRCPVFTANFNLANPDFEKIRKSDFSEYKFLNLEETILTNYPDSINNISLIKEGIKTGVFKPQYHHRDHLSTHLWMEQLQQGHKALTKGFNAGVYALSLITSPSIQKYHLAGLFYRNEKEKIDVYEANKSGIKLFEKYFDYRPESFIAPVYVWKSDFEKYLFENGIKYIQGLWFQTELKNDGFTKARKKFHYTGERNKLNQTYIIRNCSFEPTLAPKINNVGMCLEKISLAFKMGKPAIISSHRVNFIGSLHSNNRDKNLHLLATLLKTIIKKYPDVEFMSSDDLGAIC